MAHPFGKCTETAPMIRATWGETLSSTVAALIVERQQLGHRLALAPCRVMHTLAAFIAHSLEQGVSMSSIAEAVDTQDIRDLLGRAIPATHPRLYGLLDRVGEQARPLAFYLRMNQILSGPASALLLSSDPVDEACLRVVEELLSEPVLLAAHQAIGRSDFALNHLKSALAYLRATGLAHDVEQLPSGAGWRSIKRRISTDLGRGTAPSLPFRCPDGWRHDSPLSDIFEVGRKLRNCVAGIGGGGTHHFVQFFSGAEIFFASDGEPLALASIQNVGPRLWVVCETAIERPRPGQSYVIDEIRTALSEVLAEAGHALLDAAPVSAFQTIAFKAEYNTDQGDGDDDIDAAA